MLACVGVTVLSIVVITEVAEGKSFLRFTAAAAGAIRSYGGYFVIEHPQAASSWQEPCMRRLRQQRGVQAVTFHQCMCNLKTRTTGDPPGLAIVARAAGSWQRWWQFR